MSKARFVWAVAGEMKTKQAIAQQKIATRELVRFKNNSDRVSRIVVTSSEANMAKLKLENYFAFGSVAAGLCTGAPLVFFSGLGTESPAHPFAFGFVPLGAPVAGLMLIRRVAYVTPGTA